MTTGFAEGLINARWPLMMSPDRVSFHSARETWEAGRLAHCAERMEPDMVVFDVGAECGDFSSLYKTWVGSTGDVIPIEPQPAYWPSIRQTFEANGFDPPGAWFTGFAGAETTIARFGPQLAAQGWPDEDWPTCSIGRIKPDFGFQHLAQQADSVPQFRLDAFSDVVGIVPDVVVMDIEGAELECLRGCEYLLSGPRPLFYVSWHEATALDWYGATLEAMDGWMAKFDYGVTELPWHGEAERFMFYEPR